MALVLFITLCIEAGDFVRNFTALIIIYIEIHIHILVKDNCFYSVFCNSWFHVIPMKIYVHMYAGSIVHNLLIPLVWRLLAVVIISVLYLAVLCTSNILCPHFCWHLSSTYSGDHMNYLSGFEHRLHSGISYCTDIYLTLAYQIPFIQLRQNSHECLQLASVYSSLLLTRTFLRLIRK